MYGYYDFVPLSESEVLLRVSQADIFRIVIEPVLGEFILSPLREGDLDAGCYFEWFNGKLYFIDFGYSNRPLDCFGFLQAYYNLTYGEALRYVNEYFKLGLGHSEHPLKPVIHQTSRLEKIVKSPKEILFQPRNYTAEDGKYWSQFGIKKSQLIEDHVYAVRWFKVFDNDRQSTIRPFTPAYALYEFKPRVKIYNPTTRRYKGKWTSNCNRNDIGNICNISAYGSHLLVTKSYKDCRVIRNVGKKDIVWFQNEGTVPDVSIILSLCKRFQNISVMFDSDEAGRNALERVVGIFNSYYPGKTDGYITPMENDPAELRRKHGDKPLIEFLSKNHML